MNIKTLLSTGTIAAITLSTASLASAETPNGSPSAVQLLDQARSSIQQEYRVNSYAALEEDQQGSANNARYGANNEQGQGDKTRTRARDGSGSGGQHRYGQSSGGGNGGGGNQYGSGSGGGGRGGGRH